MNAVSNHAKAVCTSTIEVQTDSCPVCEGWGSLDVDDECPYCDKGQVDASMRPWIRLRAVLDGKLDIAMLDEIAQEEARR